MYMARLLLYSLSSLDSPEDAMNTRDSYQELNLREGASLTEIKVAFRQKAKTYHPDASRFGDPEKFSRAYEAYRTLVKASLKMESLYGPADTGHPYIFEGRRDMGLDIYYDICLVKPLNGQPFSLDLPWVKEEACPRCLGQGRTLHRQGHGFVYRPHSCPKCQGSGKVSSHSRLSVAVSPEMADCGHMRLRQAGNYLPKEARRGDLIITLRYAEKLPESN
jgi:DnaJ-class molecular chaperone